MTTRALPMLALVLLVLAAAAPSLLGPLRRVLADPVLPVAGLCALLLAAAAVAAAAADPVTGWRAGVAAVGAVTVATTAGSPVVRAVFRLVRREFLVSAGPAAGPASASRSDERPEAVLRGGAWIGYLERLATAATLLAGFPEGIALVLAVKGVGRYAELREQNAPEAFIIGTLASLLWATGAAGVAALLR